MTHRKRATSMRTSAAIIGGHDDLLMEILLFLPAKSLVRFKLVSKHWNSLISARSFGRRHILHHPHRHPEFQHSFILGGLNSQFFICHPFMKKLVPFDFHFRASRRSPRSFTFPCVKILHSCNGLLLIECRNSPRGCKEYYVFNPATLQYRDLCLTENFSGIYLMFDPSKSRHYRVVCFKSVEYPTRILLYDSRTHRWDDAGKTNRGRRNFYGGVYCNDRIYFLRFNWTSFYYAPKNEIYPVSGYASTRFSGAKKHYVMESNGHLHYLSLSFKPDDNLLYVFQIDDIDGFIKFCGDSVPLRVKSKRSSEDIELLGMIRGEREEDSVLLLHVPGKILIHRFWDGVCEVLVDIRREHDYEKGRLQFEFKNAYPFIPCLAPV